MGDVKFFDINKNPEIIKHYDLLKEIGILDALLKLEKTNKQQEELLGAAIAIFNQHTVHDIVNYITNDLLDKFVPSNLVFVIQEEFTPDRCYIISFINLKPVENLVRIESLEPYRNYFSLMPAPITFRAFEYAMENKQLTDVFLPLMPEIIVPMMGLDGMYGFIVFGKKVINTDYTSEEIKYIGRILKFASASLQNNIHYTRAIIESKTRLYNYAFFIKKLEEEMSRTRRYNTMFSLMMIDIDHFKNINDKYGHLAGDAVLVELASILEENIRKGDIAARFGGEEFSILLYQADVHNAYRIAERIRLFVQNREFKHLGRSIEVTISLGLTYVTNETTIESSELVNQADKALYKAKSNGRNQTVIYTPEIT